jgi:hypothetical protein
MKVYNGVTAERPITLKLAKSGKKASPQSPGTWCTKLDM